MAPLLSVIYMKFRNACVLNNRAHDISAAHLLKSRDLSQSCLPKCIPSFSLMENMLHLTTSREDAADHRVLLVVANTCLNTFLKCVEYI